MSQQGKLQLSSANSNIFIEHVLKSSVSNPVLSSTGENTRPLPNGINGMNGVSRIGPLPMRSTPFLTTAIKRPSPTPSIKRHKAEKLLQEHGSPPNVRVTAGGRIVPTDFTPLGSPRYAFAQVQRPYDRIQAPVGFHVPHRNSSNLTGHHSVPAMPNGYVAYDHEGRVIQQVDGKWLLVPFNPNGGMALYMPPPNWPFPPVGGPVGGPITEPTATHSVAMMNGVSYVVSEAFAS
jgi:hypothetical protein